MPTNTAEGGTNGTTVTGGAAGNSGGLSGRFLDLVTIGDATATLIFDNTHAAHGSLAYKFQLGAVTAEDYLQWLAGFSATDVGRATFRFNCFWTANPAAAIYLMRTASAAGTTFCGVKIDTAGKLLVVDSVGNTQATMVTAIPLNAWFHVDVEMSVVGTVGAVTIWRTDVLDSGRPTDKISGTVTAAVPFSRIRYGHTGTGVANVGPWWMDDLDAVLPDGMVPDAATFLDAGLFPDDGAYEPLGPMYLPWPEQVLDVGVQGTQAPAGSADFTVAAQDPSTLVQPNAENAAFTVAVQDPTPNVQANAECAAWTMAAQDASTVVAPSSESAALTVAAQDPTPSIAANAENAPITFVAQDPTALIGTLAFAENAAWTLVAQDPATIVAPSSDVAAWTIAAQDPIPSVKANAENAAWTFAALDPNVTIQAAAEVAAWMFAALDSAALIAANAENALWVFAAQDVTAGIGGGTTNAPAEVAAWTMVAQDGTTIVAVAVPEAAWTMLAQIPGSSASGFAPAEVAAWLVTALDALVSITLGGQRGVGKVILVGARGGMALRGVRQGTPGLAGAKGAVSPGGTSRGKVSQDGAAGHVKLP
jgi:hypothetical protein